MTLEYPGVLDQFLGIGKPQRVETLTAFRTKKNRKIHTLFRTTSSILLLSSELCHSTPDTLDELATT